MRGITSLGLSLCLLTTLAGYAGAQEPPKSPVQPKVKLPAILSSKPLPEDPKDDELRKLLKARYNEALGELKEIYRPDEGAPLDRAYDSDGLYGAWQRLVQAGLELTDQTAEKVALLTQYLEVTREAEKKVQLSYDVGRMGPRELHRARYQRLNAEIQLLRVKREADKAPGK